MVKKGRDWMHMLYIQLSALDKCLNGLKTAVPSTIHDADFYLYAVSLWMIPSDEVYLIS